MTDSGSGVYTLPPGYLAITGQTIQASQHNPPLEDLAAAMNRRYMSDGRAPMLGNVPMNGHKVTGAANGSDPQDYVTLAQMNAAPGKPFDSIAQAELYSPVTAPAFIETANNLPGDGVKRTWGYFGTTEPIHKRYIQITLDDGVTAVYYASTAPAFVVLATGQSNMQINGAAPGYDAPKNLYRWDLYNPDPSEGGDPYGPHTFVQSPTGYAFVADCWAANPARERPDADFYVVCVARHSFTISEWMVGAPTLDMFAILKANIEAALVWIGADKIDHLLWWQGEGNWNDTTYPTKWATVYARFLGEAWFNSWATPITVFGISIHGTPSLGNTFNPILRQVESSWEMVKMYEPELFQADWDPVGDYVHILPGAIPILASAAYGAHKAALGYAGWVNKFYSSLVIKGSVTSGSKSPASGSVGVGAALNFNGAIESCMAGTGYNAHAFFQNNALVTPTVVGSITSSGSSTAFNTSSDVDLKDDDGEMPLEVAMHVMRLATLRSFRWKSSGEADFGVFAQELYEVYPKAVTPGYTREDGVVVPWSVDYSKLVVPLFRAVQGIDARLSALEAKNG